MKKFILAAVVLVGMSMQAFAGIIISLNVELGHKDADRVCQPKGICNIGISVSRMVTGQIDDNTGNLVLTFKKGTSQQEAYAMEFANGVFSVPVDFSVPADVCTKLGVEKFNIKANRYKVVETSDSYSITFPQGTLTSTIIK
jgi:hypothetical protein